MAKQTPKHAPAMRPVRRGSDLATKADIARALTNYHVWRLRQVWWRRIPRNAWDHLVRPLWQKLRGPRVEAVSA